MIDYVSPSLEGRQHGRFQASFAGRRIPPKRCLQHEMQHEKPRGKEISHSQDFGNGFKSRFLR